MPSDDLRSITGLEDKHLRALARQHVTDLEGLIQANPDVLYRAMASLRPRPTLEQISRWQDDARSKLEEAVTDTSEWHNAASFVVVFSQRQAGEVWERRVEVERTEVEPERNPQVWSGWDCEPVCGWMTGQLVQAGALPAPALPAPALPAPAPAAPAPAERAQLRVDSAAIVDATGETDVVRDGVLVATPLAELVAPVRVVLTLSGARPGTPLQAVTRIARLDGPGWNVQDPVTVSGSGQAEFDLSGVPAGEHEMSLIAWAPDATATPVSVKLPRMTIRSG
ncbi:MAG TPA: hypothetical protein VIY52_05745 [Streptosporangiaceae bacterium]